MSDYTDDPMIGKVIGKGYRIDRLIGKGGMSYVYQAYDTTQNRDVAIKVITLQRDRAKELEKRFERESRVMQRLQGHSNIISIFDSGDVDRETYYLAMELIRGDTLTQRIKKYKQANTYMPYEEMLSVMHQIAAALDHMHEVAIHRDMKPSNIMIEKGSERAVLMDFGLVMDSVNNSTMGTAFGTPRYIAPEQAISSQQAVPQSDLYSLGVIIYECLTNQTPFDEESAMSMALSHITNQPPDPRDFRPDLPESVAKVVLKSLEKSPDDRYPKAIDLILALEAAINGTVPVASAPAADHEDTHRPEPTQGLPDGWQPTPSKESVLTGEHRSSSGSISGSHIATTTRSKMPLIIGGAVVALILIAALFAVLSGGGEGEGSTDDGAVTRPTFDATLTGGDDGGASADNGAALQLLYSNNSLTIYNDSGSRVSLANYQLALPDRSRVLDMNLFEEKSLDEDGCVLVSLSDSTTVNAICKSVIRVTHSRRITENYFWVWDSSVNTTGQFVVLYNGREVQSCSISDGQCRTGG